MAYVLTSEQVQQIINNTLFVLMVRPDMLAEWRTNLRTLMNQAADASLDDEAIFVASVLTLLYSPDDTLPTGTVYDRAWESIVSGLQTGVIQSGEDQDEDMTLDRLLKSVAEAMVAVIVKVPEQQETVINDLTEMRSAAANANVTELIQWIDDALALLEGTPATDLGHNHQGVYAAYWDAMVRAIQS
jgi:hypothetical protein